MLTKVLGKQEIRQREISIAFVEDPWAFIVNPVGKKLEEVLNVFFKVFNLFWIGLLLPNTEKLTCLVFKHRWTLGFILFETWM